jgi:hypothetical protein
LKVGNRVKTSDGQIGIVYSVYWAGVAGSGVSYIRSVKIVFKDGSFDDYDPKSLQVISEDADVTSG